MLSPPNRTRPGGAACAGSRRGRAADLVLPAVLAALAAGVAPEGFLLPAAQAQTAKQEAVMSRARPDFDPIGIEIFLDEEDPAPAVTVFPTLDLRGGYDSNVFRQADGAVDDLYWEAVPKLIVTNTSQDLGLEAGVTATVRRNLEYQSNDFEDYDVYGQASYFFMEDSDVSLQLGYSRLHEDRSDPDSTGPGENILQYDRLRAVVYSRNRFSDFLVNPQGELYYYDYQDQDGRDHWEGVSRVRLGYEFEPGYVAFVEPAFDVRRYVQEVDSLGLNRDSWGWSVVGGLSYNVSAVTSAEIFAGYFQQKYEDPTLADAAGLSFGGAMTWNPFDVVTVNASTSRSVQESTLAGVSSTVASSYALGVDYDLGENLMLTSLGTVSTSDFQGSSRYDVTYSVGGGVVYLVNEFARSSLNARYEKRDSNEGGNGYQATVVEALVTLQY